MNKHIILGVHITDRLRKVAEVQQLFSQYGCNIKTRLGLHEVENVCSPNGIVLLEMYGDEAVCFELADKLAAIDGIEVKKMVFEH
ncbi:MAG TPA: hypothetical protein P5318_02565 [Candidatus Hydrogenedentes bacterium]|nr:hypothetical protein [Candidatus Hydrogenedentota bacterium]HOV73584.1 hypothetical protein [Candidatus Hydrogenedentota bacterium]HPC16518.1 hypothetical protein [Candidatus Hydrogenedentota bacterium]HRT18983.1 hypothetical protein [Candidatus Hydrogenedentota bacterium]HRT65661.1 hypothetical protein [Candidatus Hydrogenedentota bacterium]